MPDRITVTNSPQQLDTSAAIRTAIGGFEVSGYWAFPGSAESDDGCVGKLCVSEFHTTAVTGANQRLAIHVTFEIPGGFVPAASADIRPWISVRNLHFTARPENSQLIISENGNSRIQQEVATHRGANNDWTHNNNNERMRALAIALGLDPNNLPAARTAVNTALSIYDGANLRELGPQIVRKIARKIEERLVLPTGLNATVTVDVRQENWV